MVGSNKLLALSFWEKFVSLHGFLAMSSLILFGGAITLYFASKRDNDLVIWLRDVLLLLLIDLVTLDIVGLVAYIPYRASNGPRAFLKSSEATAWLHGVIFEHKEFLAFAPPILILTAYLVTKILGRDFNHAQATFLRKTVLLSLITALALVLLIAFEATLVAKVAPLK